MTAPVMSAEAAAWVRDEVIGSYHWAIWRTDYDDSTPANERNVECEPGWVPDEPYPVTVSFCDRPVCTLVGPGRIHPDWSKGYPYRHYRVWLAHAHDRYAVPAKALEELETVPAPTAAPTLEPAPAKKDAESSAAVTVQLDIFAALP